jgi:hypothetical protein
VTGRRRDKGKVQETRDNRAGCRQKTTRPGTDRRGKRRCRLQIGETRLVIDRKGRTVGVHNTGDKQELAREGAIRRYSTTSTYRAVNDVPKLGNP